MAVARSISNTISLVPQEQWSEKVALTSITRSHREEDLADVHTSNASVGLPPGTTHTSLQPIGAGT